MDNDIRNIIIFVGLLLFVLITGIGVLDFATCVGADTRLHGSIQRR